MSAILGQNLAQTKDLSTRMNVRLWIVGLIAAFLAACSPTTTDTPTGVSSQNNPQSPIPNIEIATQTAFSADLYPQAVTGALGPVTYPQDVNPLTGLPFAGASSAQRRPIVAKISNAPAIVRPQAGLNQADMVFEHYAEGGLTRFSAIFYGQTPERVGSIRSARLIDHELVPMVDGILAFSGASLGVEKYIFGSDYVNAFYSDIDGIEAVYPGAPQPPSEYAERAYKGVLIGAPTYWRDPELPVPHNYFVDLRSLWALAARDGHNNRPRLQGIAFHSDVLGSDGRVGRLIDVRYRGTRILWHYDDASGRYFRTTDGLTHHDALDGSQVSADNVVVLFADHAETPVVESQFDGQPIWSLQIAVWGTNDAVLFRDGQRIDGVWTRTVREDFFSLRSQDGELLYLKPGNTWFQVMPPPSQMNPNNEWLRSE